MNGLLAFLSNRISRVERDSHPIDSTADCNFDDAQVKHSSAICDLRHYSKREYDIYGIQVDYGTFIQSRAAGGLADHCGISRSYVPFLCSAHEIARSRLLHGT